MLAYAVLAALVARERHGVGQEVDASHLGSMTWLQGLSVSCKLMVGFPLQRTFRSQAGNPLWNHYECKDGKNTASSGSNQICAIEIMIFAGQRCFEKLCNE
mgnify:CR=1 FL=1